MTLAKSALLPPLHSRVYIATSVLPQRCTRLICGCGCAFMLVSAVVLLWTLARSIDSYEPLFDTTSLAWPPQRLPGAFITFVTFIVRTRTALFGRRTHRRIDFFTPTLATVIRPMIRILVVPLPDGAQELHHIDSLGPHLGHPWVLAHAPGCRTAGAFFLKTRTKHRQPTYLSSSHDHQR